MDLTDTYYYYWYTYCTFLFSLCKISLCYISWNARWEGDSIHYEADSHESEWLWYNGAWSVRRNKETRTHWLPGNALSYYAENFLSRFPRRKIRPLSGRRNRLRICLPGDFNDIGKYNLFLCKLCKLSLSILLCWSLSNLYRKNIICTRVINISTVRNIVLKLFFTWISVLLH